MGNLRVLRLRPRRLRVSKPLRDLVSETTLSSHDLILPLFVNENIEKPVASKSLEGIFVYPPNTDHIVKYINEALDYGVKSFLLFGIPKEKDFIGTRAFAKEGPVQSALRNIRREIGWDPIIFTDLCICGYTSHGHCGLPKESRRGTIIDNDSTLEIYAKIAVSQAEAGSDFISPSGMMDGQVRAIREALDKEGFTDVGIMSYSVKYASNFYGPFRDLMSSAPSFGDRRSYQMDPRNAYEAIKEVMLDLEEGADIVMVKPALPYLDIIRLVKERFPYIPLAAYSVSGEYSMIKAASKEGFLDEKKTFMEVLYSIKRAGADIIITYYALEAAKLMKSDILREIF